jgi:hypothetical protein
MIFQDGAAPRYHTAVTKYLHEKVPGRWIDLFSEGYIYMFFWRCVTSHLKQKIFKVMVNVNVKLSLRLTKD